MHHHKVGEEKQREGGTPREWVGGWCRAGEIKRDRAVSGRQVTIKGKEKIRKGNRDLR